MTGRTLGAADRPLRYRLRPGLAWRRLPGGRVRLADPATGGHHELPEADAAIAGWLGEGVSLNELMRRYHAQFAPRRITRTAIQRRLTELHGAGLVEAVAQDQPDALWRRAQQRRRAAWRNAWTRLLAWRVGGIAPGVKLKGLRPLAAALFSGPGAVATLLLWLAGAVALLSDPARLVAEAPRLAWLASPAYAATLLATFAVVKTLHEAGHLLAAVRCGCRVREVGLLMLFFTPCLYCDVSDAWRLRRRRGRVLIAGAGVLVEVTLATVAAVVWRFAEPGLLATLAMNAMLVATVGTLLVNLNPLVRFDGYYLLSDLTETPNLAERGRTAASRRLIGWARRDAPPTADEPAWIVAYGLAAWLYVTLLVAAFVWLIVVTGQTLRLDGPAWALAMLVVGATVGPMLGSVGRQLATPHVRPRLRWRRLAMAGVLGAFAATLLAVPVPRRIAAEATLACRNATTLCVTRGGHLVEASPPGEWVERGATIARLTNPEVERLVLRARQALASRELERRLLEARRHGDPEAAGAIPAADAAIDAARVRLDEALAEADRLVVRAPHAGWLLAPPPAGDAPSGHAAANVEQPTPERSPLDPYRRGDWLEVGTAVATVADRREPQLELTIDAALAAAVRPGQPVRCRLNGRLGRIDEGVILEVGQRAEPTAATSPSVARRATPFAPTRLRHARARLTADAVDRAPLGGGGVARIDVGSAPIATQGLAWLRRTFATPR